MKQVKYIETILNGVLINNSKIWKKGEIMKEKIYRYSCKNCGQKMLLEDTDFHFKGCKDEYYICEKCGTTAIAKIRYNKMCKITFNDGDN